MSATSILRIKTEQRVPDGWRIVRILSTWTVPNNDGGTGWHYEYDVEVERVSTDCAGFGTEGPPCSRCPDDYTCPVLRRETRIALLAQEKFGFEQPDWRYLRNMWRNLAYVKGKGMYSVAVLAEQEKEQP